ncbi:hypothetical protein CDD81_978 [Ophiocordyceps australis]|uniref:Uncharacterized protein n=1 Tax=Ophiocordyceps australis TaxID=1399860 RepID=A0A2C5Y1B2_9HYPO|nr:hypothetical protein CDD81_978 [Ophiocordyceps australis]
MTNAKKTPPKDGGAKDKGTADVYKGREGTMPDPCSECGARLGHAKKCSRMYQDCWTYGMNLSGAASGEAAEDKK